jgi:hypothetical protein
VAFADKVTAWLKLDAESGTRVNAHTTGTAYDLSDVNTVGFQAGVHGNAAKFVAASSERLECLDTTKYQNKLNWTIGFAIYNARGDGTNNVQLLGKSSTVAADREWASFINPSTNLLSFGVNHAAGFWQLDFNITGLLHSNADPGWDFLFFGRRSSPSNQLFGRINGGSVQTFNVTSEVKTGAGLFKVGIYRVDGLFFNGAVDELVWCDSALATSEMDELYNAGAWQSYDDIFPAGSVPDDPTGFVVERGTDGVNFAEIETTAADVETYTDTNLTPGRRYYWRVKATNAQGDSAYTDIVNVVTLFGPVTSEFAQHQVTSTFAQEEVTSTFAQEEITSVFRRL